MSGGGADDRIVFEVQFLDRGQHFAAHLLESRIHHQDAVRAKLNSDIRARAPKHVKVVLQLEGLDFEFGKIRILRNPHLLRGSYLRSRLLSRNCEGERGRNEQPRYN